jgi:hypothetical protein
MVGVSKRCCPVCAYMLQRCDLPGRQSPIRIHGSHSTVSPCALPPWLPVRAIDSIVAHFSNVLKGMLERLVYNRAHKTRRASSETGYMSPASADSEDDSEEDRLEDEMLRLH